jgi:hypothetical protein
MTRRLHALWLLPLLMAFRPGTFEPEFLQWTPPTHYVDGTVLPVENIVAYVIDCASDVGDQVHQTTPGGLTDRWDVPANTFLAGTWTCTAKTVAESTSDPSLPVEFVVARYGFTVAPLPPVGLGVG